MGDIAWIFAYLKDKIERNTTSTWLNRISEPQKLVLSNACKH